MKTKNIIPRLNRCGYMKHIMKPQVIKKTSLIKKDEAGEEIDRMLNLGYTVERQHGSRGLWKIYFKKVIE